MTAKTEAQKKAQKAYMEKFSVARVRMTTEQHETIKVHAQSRGESVNSFFIRAAQETMERDNAVQEAPQDAQSDS